MTILPHLLQICNTSPDPTTIRSNSQTAVVDSAAARVASAIDPHGTQAGEECDDVYGRRPSKPGGSGTPHFDPYRDEWGNQLEED
jgi:hypothetical protein